MYTVYKITNLINQKYYIGVHKTLDPYDNYMGSGIAIKDAIKKYNISNFKKEILLITEIKNEAFLYEKELTKNYMESTNYNMRLGGEGGFTKENAKKGLIAKSKLGGNVAKNLGYCFGGSKGLDPKASGRLGGLANKGKPKSEEVKQKLRDTWAKKKQKPVV